MKNRIIIILSFIIYLILSFFLVKNAWIKQELSYDLAEVNHVKYGLFDANEWKVKATQVIYKKIESTDFINENRETIQKHISQVLYSLVDELEEYVEQEKRKGEVWEQVIKGVVANVAFNADEIREQVPSWSNIIIENLQELADDPEIKNIFKERVDNFIQADENYHPSTLISIYAKYDTESKKETVLLLENSIKDRTHKVLYFGIPLLLISILLFVIFYMQEADISFYSMIFLLIILLLVGISIPMIQLEAKLDLFEFNILGESLTFKNQSLFYQSKSILQVFKILLQDGKILSVITAFFIILFSIIFPFSKLIAAFLYKKGNDSPIIDFLCFKSGKWSMADVMVVAIFLSYIGINSLINSQMESMSKTVDQLEIIASNGSSGLQFGVLVFLTFVILSIFFSIKLKENGNYNYHSKKGNYF